jgi:hypothetical protein
MLTAPAGNASTVGTYVYNNYTGTYDPLLIRWANVDATIGPEPEVWQPTVTNTAGFLRLQSGSQSYCSFKFKTRNVDLYRYFADIHAVFRYNRSVWFTRVIT